MHHRYTVGDIDGDCTCSDLRRTPSNAAERIRERSVASGILEARCARYEIAQAFGSPKLVLSGRDPRRDAGAVEAALAQDPDVDKVDQARFWNGCPHGGEPSADFLLWHRAYLYYFERILREVAY
ncbi:MAG TPA: tyrosinase family protein [Terriglobia bacterium]|nr:tyrosinase family protein [Terriglobia bacterium]